MRPIRPERAGALGITLIEMVVAMVLIGIIVAATVYFFYPVAQSVDIVGRARLTDTADNALQRIGREVRLALPNSVRTATHAPSNREFVEFLPVRTAGRYRSQGGGAASGTNCPDTGEGVPGSDQLSFDADPTIDTCFKTLGTVDVGTVTNADWLVLNNYGAGFDGQNAYTITPTVPNPLNRRRILTAVNEGTRARITFTSTAALSRTLHDSVGRRFFVVVGNATSGRPEAVTYECNTATGQLIRRWGYDMEETQSNPPAFGGAGATSAEIARDVSACSFEYNPNGVGAHIGLLTLRLTLSRAVSGSISTVSLYHAVHVNNVP